MSRLIIASVVIAVVLTVYAVIDCAMTESKRTRALSKPVWLLVVLVVPIVGPVLWILFGKGLLLRPVDTGPSAPDDDEDFLKSLGHETVHDDRIRQLEDELRALDEQLTTGDLPRDPDETNASGDLLDSTNREDDAKGDDETSSSPGATASSAASADRPSESATNGSGSHGTTGSKGARGADGGAHETNENGDASEDDEHSGNGSGRA